MCTTPDKTPTTIRVKTMNPITMSKIPKSNNIFTFHAFLKHCKDSTLTDNIGYGKLANTTLMSDIAVKPSEVLYKFYKNPHWASQVVWFEFKKPKTLTHTGENQCASTSTQKK